MTRLTKDNFDAFAASCVNNTKNYVRVGMSTCGLAAGAQPAFDTLTQEITTRKLPFEVQRSGCIGMCYAEPLVEICIDGTSTFYKNVDSALATRIVETHIEQKKSIAEHITAVSDKEYRIVLRNCGRINPERLEDYIAQNGYRALKKTLFEMSGQGVIDELKVAGLRGRGGAGFPTHLKWSLSKKNKTAEKYVICNGDEGDPGAYMDRSVLESDPHSVIEGMLIGGYAMDASQGYIYIRAEYPLAIERIQAALTQAREAGLLGKNIMGSEFSFDMEIRLGAGAFVCGEETALIASIEGMRGTPRPRPPFPTDHGLWEAPTSINNVETFANIAPIILKGGAWFASIGTEKSKGTKVFALTGKTSRSGLVEIPMGTLLSTILYDIGDGAANGKEVLAVQTGGPSGGMIPKQHFNTPVSYEHLQQLGSIMGSGGMIVMDTDDCVVDIARFYLGFCVDESCGKCAPCRIGGKQMLLILDAIAAGKATDTDLVNLRAAAKSMQKASLCGLGQSAPNPILSSLNYFAADYEAHVKQRKCKAGKCLGLLSYTIDNAICKRCGLCKRNCAVNAISGDKNTDYVVDQATCIKCGRCFEVCKFEAVIKG